ncbi:MAG: Spo0B domain-containing protein [Clostridia bacterium]|nr:Spo0B domain-containing protein [Clostridia bacterium]
MRRLTSDSINFRKLSLMAILVNSAQIASALFISGILLFSPELINSVSMRVLLISVLVVNASGAILDIREAVRTRALDEHNDMLEDSIDHLTLLNTEMRKQRHDFMNHLQVIYSLLELNEPKEAIDYIERVHTDLNKVSKILKTSYPAVNALIAAKSNDAEEAGIAFVVNVSTPLDRLPLTPYEISRALSNLIDNAFDALVGQSDGLIRLSFEENASHYRMTVSNNGPAIDQDALGRIFAAGYSTKGTERGMGLSIVSEIVASAGGQLFVDSQSAITKFIIELPKRTENEPSGK